MCSKPKVWRSQPPLWHLTARRRTPRMSHVLNLPQKRGVCVRVRSAIRTCVRPAYLFFFFFLPLKDVSLLTETVHL